ncbi:Pex12 amino terminal region-domain-containing protein [Dipodascopsis uninucleata]
MSGKSRHITQRVGQVDADLLDNELFDILRSKLLDALKLVNSRTLDQYDSEVQLLLRLLLFKVTVWDNSATYGGLLENLRFVDGRGGLINSGTLKNPSRKQKLLLGFLLVFGDYTWRKFLDAISSSQGEGTIKERLYGFALKLETVYSSLDFLNFISFLYNGKYPSLFNRLFRLRLISSSRSLSREVSFEFLNRKLVWDEFTNFLLYVLPLIRLPRIKRRFEKFIKGPSVSAEKIGPLQFLPERICAICYHTDSNMNVLPGTANDTNSNLITNPYSTVECGHIYCYVCITTQIEEQDGEGWNCLRCGTLVKESGPWRDVDAEKTSTFGNGGEYEFAQDPESQYCENTEDDTESNYEF